MKLLWLSAALACVARAALAQPAEPPPPPPLATIQDPKQLAATLSAITQDPAIPVDDPNTRALAQAMMSEGVRQLQTQQYDQALANFLEAYAKFPSPKILLNIASTLRDMGRLADAANTYQRYLLDPSTSAERVGEVKQLLLELDAQLTILTVRVTPRGSDISIDAGPFITVGSSLVTRVRPGIHLVRVRYGDQLEELGLNGFDGENKQVAAALPPAPPVERIVTAKPIELKPPPEQVNGWLVDGTRYAGDGKSNERVPLTVGGQKIAAIVPKYDSGGEIRAKVTPPERIASGAIAVLRIDGKGRGFAGGAGIALARGHFEIELMALKSNEYGAYLGLRYRFLTGFFRPYVGLGAPAFAYDHDAENGTTETKLGLGARGAVGLELFINGHLSVLGDVGYEHFFSVDDRFETDVFVPTLGVIGRL